MRELGIGHLIDKGRVRRTVLSALKDAGVEIPCILDIPEEDCGRLKRLGNRAFPHGEEYTLEEFVWAFGEDAEQEIQKRADHVLGQIHTVEDICTLAEQGVDQLVDAWGFLGELDEDLLLRIMERQLKNGAEKSHKEKDRLCQAISQRREKLRKKLFQDHPEMTEYLEESRSHRIAGKYTS